MRTDIWETWIWILFIPLTDCVTMLKCLTLFEYVFPVFIISISWYGWKNNWNYTCEAHGREAGTSLVPSTSPQTVRTLRPPLCRLVLGLWFRGGSVGVGISLEHVKRMRVGVVSLLSESLGWLWCEGPGSREEADRSCFKSTPWSSP